ncbi:hypothetical protein, partial [Salmonella enterica]|uniref:hypothetical protein n=1 Tax=Salmonella enterica TaxID=28901 RepID=UPI0031B5F008
PSIAEDNSVTIFDKMYTGGSINEVFDKLQNKIVLKIGLFPKSFSHLCTVDYVVYAGRLIKSIDIIEKCSEENWHKKALYLAIEQGDKNCSTR